MEAVLSDLTSGFSGRFAVMMGMFHSGITAAMYGVSKLEPNEMRSPFSYETHSFLILPSLCTAVYFAATDLIAKNYNVPMCGPLEFILSFLAATFLQDTIFWWQHWAHHRSKWMWEHHRLHHTLIAGRNLDALSSFIASTSDNLLAAFASLSPFMFLSSLNYWSLVTAAGAFGAWGIFIHAREPHEFFSGGILNDAAHHHVHHHSGFKMARNMGYYYNIWDHVMGTYGAPCPPPTRVVKKD